MNHHNRSRQIRCEDLVDVLVVKLLSRAEKPIACVIDHNVYPSVLFKHLGNKAVDAIYIRHIKYLTIEGIGIFCDQFLYLFGISDGADDRIALFQKLLCHLISEAA